MTAKRSRRIFVGAAAFACAVAGIAFAFALPPQASSAQADYAAKPGCKKAGMRYFGSTSQNGRICLTVTRDNKQIAEYAYEFHGKCPHITYWPSGGIGPNGEDLPYKGKLIRIASNGSFSHFEFTGRFIGRGKVTGTLRYPYENCDVGVVNWTAHRVGK